MGFSPRGLQSRGVKSTLPGLTNSGCYEGLRADNHVNWVEEPRGLEHVWKKLAGKLQSSPKLWMDAYLAAFAIESGYQFVTTDKAFKQFKNLNLRLLANT